MIKDKLKLDEREAWVLTEMLERCLVNHDSFIAIDEDYNEYHDEELETEVNNLSDKLLKLRGF